MVVPGTSVAVVEVVSTDSPVVASTDGLVVVVRSTAPAPETSRGCWPRAISKRRTLREHTASVYMRTLTW